MKAIVTLLLSVLSFSVQGQYFWNETFETPYDGYRNHFIIDTVNYHHNLWQIGRPHKTVFDSVSALSLPNVIVTDTLYPYPPRDTSVFIVQQYFVYTWMLTLNFQYKLDIDSGTIAKVEISGDRGLNWINPLTQDTTYEFYWNGPKPRLDTSTPTWQSFQVDMGYWAMRFPGTDTTYHYRISDTILFRFTFISDTDTSTKDGWMMDNFYVENARGEGKASMVQNNDAISLYPVPSKGQLYYNASSVDFGKAAIIVYNIKGQEVYRSENTPRTGILNLPLPDGNYVLKYATQNSYAIKRFVIRR